MDLSDLGVVDGHAHSLIPEWSAVSVDGFLELFSEGRPGAMAGHVEHTRYFQRTVRALARRLGCDPTVPAVLERRRARGAAAAAAMLAECRVDALLVDTGYPPDAMSLGDMRRLLPCAVYEVFTWRIPTSARRPS